jgi:DNA-binding GntR family transcriptional regulator
MSTQLEVTLTRDVLPRLESLQTRGELVATMVKTLAVEIIDGTLPPGHELTSAELGRRFQTSRTPVREALGVLAHEGLIELEARRRPRVSAISVAEIRDLYQTRAALYVLVSEEIVRTASDASIGLLEAPLRAMESAATAGDVDAFFPVSIEFRHVEAQICGNRIVGQTIESLGLRVYRVRRLGLSLPGRLEHSLADHRRLYEAYRERDARMASATTQALVLRALAAIERVLT